VRTAGRGVAALLGRLNAVEQLRDKSGRDQAVTSGPAGRVICLLKRLPQARTLLR
jgi:hypothetical protein